MEGNTKQQSSEMDEVENDTSNSQDTSGKPNESYENFIKRKGTKDIEQGPLFEFFTYAFYAIKLTLDKKVSNFKLTSNDRDAGNFDDIRIGLKFEEGTEKEYRFQLKHRHKNQNITKELLENQTIYKKKNKFSLDNYFPIIVSNKWCEDVNHILYTNGGTDIKDGDVLQSTSSFGVKKCHNENYHDQLSTNEENTNALFHIELIQESQTKQVEGCTSFYLYTKQNNVDTLQTNIEAILQNDLKCDFLPFLKIMYDFWKSDHVLTKDIVLKQLTELVLSSHICSLTKKCTNYENEKIEHLKALIAAYDVIIMEEGSESSITNIWQETQYCKDEKKLTDLRSTEKVPLVVKVTEFNKNLVKKVLKLFRKPCQKFILIGKIDKNDFKNQKVCQNLYDVFQENRKLYDQIAKSFRVSLQGREDISLEQLLNIDSTIAKNIGMKELFKMSLNESLLIGEKTKVPKLHISRSIVKNGRVFMEKYIFEICTEPLKVFCAPPGMGKSRLFRVLTLNCLPESWGHLVDLKKIDFEKYSHDYPKILHKLLELDNDNLATNIKKILLNNKKIEIFLDGLDEVNFKYLDNAMKFIKYLSEKFGNVWISCRENLRKNINSLNVTPIEIKEFDDKQQKDYITRSLGTTYDFNKIEKIIDKIFDNVKINSYPQLLGIPLQLKILCKIFLNDENLQDQSIFILTHMYQKFFEHQLKFTQKKAAITEEMLRIGGISQETLLKMYEIPALKLCLNLDDFRKMGIDHKQWEVELDRIKENGDRNGIIRSITENNEVVFNHQTYPEYFTCVWLKNNESKLALLDNFFSKKYENIRRMFDIMMAEKNPLHLSVVYQNMTEFKKHLDAKFDEKDEGERTALHLACSYGKPFISEGTKLFNYIKMVDMLLEKQQIISEMDTLFKLDCIGYALKVQFLYPIEKILEKKLLSYDQIRKKIGQSGIESKRLAIDAAEQGQVNLLKEIIDAETKFINENIHGQYLMHVLAKTRIVGKSPETNNKLACLHLLIENGVNINQPAVSGKSALDYACQFGAYNIIKVLLQNNAECSEGNTVLHVLAQHQTINEEVKNIMSTYNIDVNARNDKGQTAIELARFSRRENEELLINLGASVIV